MLNGGERGLSSIYAELYPFEDVSINNATINVSPTNVSKDINSLHQKIKNGRDIFLLGISKFTDKAPLVNDSVDFYIGDEISDSNGAFATSYTITLQKSVQAGFVAIYFDTINNEHPNNIIINGEKLTLNSPVCLLAVSETPVTIIISNWNKPNRPLRIQGITTFIKFDKEIISVNLGGQSKTDSSLPSWGIKSNSGDIELFDAYNVIENMSSKGFLENCCLNVYLDINNKKTQIGQFYISTANKSERKHQTRLEFQDVLISWQNIQMPEIPFGQSTISAYNFLLSVMKKNRIVWDANTESYLKKIVLSKPYLSAGSFWEMLNKICELSMSYIYCNREGTPIIKSNGGR